jgi:2-methylcitrate dehydratase PrpD
MTVMNRRDILGTGLALASSSLWGAKNSYATDNSDTTTSTKAPLNQYGASNTGLGISKKLTEFTSSIQFETLSSQAIHEAKRATLDWLGCALIGSKHPTSINLVKTLHSIGSYPAVRVIGHPSLKMSLLDSPVVNGQMGHILDFDDTHLGGVILHTSTATLPALLAIGEQNKLNGKILITSLVAAFEGGIRTGQAMPNHHRGGWHLTGTLGTVASSIGASRMLGLDQQKTLMSLGLGCTQAAGMQQNRGSDCKSIHAGKSAYHGVFAATLAANGLNSSPEILEGNLGFTRIYSTTQNLDAVTKDLGKEWIITGNGYKPYSCGVVLHPLIDASIELSQQSQIPWSEIANFEVMVHPDVIRITGVDQPGSGLMSKFSANHAAAVSYIDRAGGVPQFSNEKSQDASVISLRKIVTIQSSSNLQLDQAKAGITTKSGARFESNIEHAKGTFQNPLSDADIELKFLQNAQACISKDQAKRIIDMVWNLEKLSDINLLARLYS